ncbi:type 1 glutamine amidotransferase domain-containing protein [Sporomusa sp.]|uniref:type 1 glutamine amidotransferase domain-containing protein n=1 Tax=Sporomusa sp. TaxID=2078658 RepID=UPI002B64772C|nr:type 1 glutamine amidotransferase domain-containing protein [Sporomusa sp.]HWR45725.1 type 1 glutamine amidotransferase domain-containing protein [Sporomusa sp.]
MTVQKKILMIVTSFDQIDEHHSTGLWLEEFAVPYLEFCAAEYGVTVASPRGGAAPIDAQSVSGNIPNQWQEAVSILNNTEILYEMNVEDYDAVIFPGGHGPMFDLAKDEQLARLLQYFAAAGKVIGAVCHGPAALVRAIMPDGRPLVAGKKVTAFTNEEEQMTHLNTLVPFTLETKLKELGAEFLKNEPWANNVVIDENLITGQNRQSSFDFAKAVLAILANKVL